MYSWPTGNPSEMISKNCDKNIGYVKLRKAPFMLTACKLQMGQVTNTYILMHTHTTMYTHAYKLHHIKMEMSTMRLTVYEEEEQQHKSLQASFI